MRRSLGPLTLAFVLLAEATADAQSAAIPVEPIGALLDAFRTHEIVAISDPHGNLQLQTFLLSLIRDARFPAAVDDIVSQLASELREGDRVVILSNGGFGGIHDKLLRALDEGAGSRSALEIAPVLPEVGR